MKKFCSTLFPISLSFLTSFSGIALLASSAWLITGAAQHPSLAVLSVAIVGVRFFGLTKAVFRYSERLLSHSQTLHHLALIRANILSELSKRDTSPLSRSHSAELLGRFLQDVDTIGDRFIRGIYPISNAIIGCLFLWPMLFMISTTAGFAAALTQFLLGFTLPAALAFARHKKAHQLQLEKSKIRRHFGNLALLRNDLAYTGTAAQILTMFSTKTSKYAALNISSTNMQSLKSFVSTVSAPVSLCITLPILTKSISQRTLTAPETAAFAFACLAAYELTASVGNAIDVLLECREAARRIQELIVPQAECTLLSRIINPNHSVAVECQDITHAYAGNPENVLTNFSAIFPHKTVTCVSGFSGCGKSTLLNILLGIVTPVKGQTSLASQTITAARNRDHIFANTIRENLVLANSSASDAALIDALKTVELHAWFQNLPHGLNTYLGEGGCNLSGGERQRFLIARALLTAAPFICIDECTSHIPTSQENIIIESIHNLSQKPAIAIAIHRENNATTHLPFPSLSENICVAPYWNENPSAEEIPS